MYYFNKKRLQYFTQSFISDDINIDISICYYYAKQNGAI